MRDYGYAVGRKRMNEVLEEEPCSKVPKSDHALENAVCKREKVGYIFSHDLMNAADLLPANIGRVSTLSFDRVRMRHQNLCELSYKKEIEHFCFL